MDQSGNRALHVPSGLDADEMSGSAFVGNALVLLCAAAEGDEGLLVTPVNRRPILTLRQAKLWHGGSRRKEVHERNGNLATQSCG